MRQQIWRVNDNSDWNVFQKNSYVPRIQIFGGMKMSKDAESRRGIIWNGFVGGLLLPRLKFRGSARESQDNIGRTKRRCGCTKHRPSWQSEYDDHFDAK